jgi:hypothetical protein
MHREPHAIVVVGTLQVSFVNGFEPSIGQSFDFINALMTQSIYFDNLVLPPIDGGTWDTSALASGGPITAVVPEPWAGVFTVALGYGLLSRKRTSRMG